MKKHPVYFDSSLKNGCSPAPYFLEVGKSISVFYPEPLLFHSEYDPTTQICCVEHLRVPERCIKGGSYAYCDADVSYCRSGFGLCY